MKQLIFVLIILLHSCGCPNGEHCELTIENQSNLGLIVTIDGRDSEQDTLYLTGVGNSFEGLSAVSPNNSTLISSGELGLGTSIESALYNKCWKNSMCIYFFDYNDTKNNTIPHQDLFQQGKLLKCKDYNIDSLNKYNWVITYP